MSAANPFADASAQVGRRLGVALKAQCARRQLITISSPSSRPSHIHFIPLNNDPIITRLYSNPASVANRYLIHHGDRRRRVGDIRWLQAIHQALEGQSGLAPGDQHDEQVING